MRKGIVIPKTIWPYLLTTAIGAAAGVYVEPLASARRLADIQKDAAMTQIKAVETARAEERRRTATQQEIAEDAAKQRDAARADAARAAFAAGGLRKQVVVLAERARGFAVGAGSAPTGASLICSPTRSAGLTRERERERERWRNTLIAPASQGSSASATMTH